MKTFTLLLSTLSLATATLRGIQNEGTVDLRTLNGGEQLVDVAEERQLQMGMAGPGGSGGTTQTLPNKLPDICYLIQQQFPDKVTCTCSSVIVLGLISFNCQGSVFTCTMVPQGEFCTVPNYSGQVNFVFLQLSVQTSVTVSGTNTWLNNTQYGDISLGQFEADLSVSVGPTAITKLPNIVSITNCKVSFFQGNTNAVSCTACTTCTPQITGKKGIEVTCDSRNIPICIPIPFPNPTLGSKFRTSSLLGGDGSSGIQDLLNFTKIVENYGKTLHKTPKPTQKPSHKPT